MKILLVLAIAICALAAKANESTIIVCSKKVDDSYYKLYISEQQIVESKVNIVWPFKVF